MLSLSFSISCTKKIMKFPTIYVALLDRIFYNIIHNVNNIHHNKNVKNVSFGVFNFNFISKSEQCSFTFICYFPFRWLCIIQFIFSTGYLKKNIFKSEYNSMTAKSLLFKD